jgi:putative ABC transport system permease protein
MRTLVQFLQFFSLRHLARDPWRTVTVTAGIAVGVSVFLSIRLAVNASVDSFSRSMDRLAGKAEYTVRSNGRGVSDSLVAKLSAYPAVRHATPVLSSYVKFNDPDEEPFLLLGIDPLSEKDFRETRWLAKDGAQAWKILVELLSEPFTLIASQGLASSYNLKVDDEVRVLHGHNIESFRLIGLLEDLGTALAEGGKIAVCDLATAQDFLSCPGVVSRIDLILRPWTGRAELASIEETLPKDCKLVRPNETKETSLSMIGAYRMNLSVLSFVSLFVGMFLVFSVVSINAARRRHETATLLSLGSESRQIFFMFLAEGAFFGLAGWLMGFPLSIFLARRLLHLVSATITTLFVKVDVEKMILSPEEIIVSFFMTLAVSVMAAYIPARETARIAPREAMSLETFERSRRLRAPRLAAAGLVLIGLSFPISMLPAVHETPVGGYAAIFMIFVGFAMLSPAVLLFLGRYAPTVMRRVFGEPGHLAASYVSGAVSRTAIAVGALITAIALFIGVSIMVSSFRNTVRTWVEQNIVGDLFVRPDASEINQYQVWMAPEVVRYLQTQSAVQAGYFYRRALLADQGGPFLLEAGSIDVLWHHGRFLLMGGNEDYIMERLIRGKGVIVSEVYATRRGLKPGDRLTLAFGGIPHTWDVLGVYRDYRTGGGVIFIDINTFQEIYADHRIGGVNLFLRPGADPHLFRSNLLKRFGSQYTLAIAIGGNLRQSVLKVFDETFSITYVLMFIALLVAALGVATTLSLLIRERRRQLGMILAVGGSPGQVRLMVVLEALLMGAAGHIVGMGCGLVLSYLLIFVINKQSFGWTFLYEVPPWTGLISFILVLLTAILAAIPPANTASRVNLAELLKGQ